MPSIIRATTTSGLQVAPDNSGSLQLQTNGTTTAVTIDTSQNATFAGTVSMGSSFLRNRIINGDMRIDQRNNGSAVTLTNASFTYGVDRWAGAVSTSTSTVTIQRVAIGSNGFQYGLRILRGSGTYTGMSTLIQEPESLNTNDLQGQSITISYWARQGSSSTATIPYIQLVSGTGTDQGIAGANSGSWTGWVSVGTSAPILTTTLTRYTATFTVPSNSNELAVLFNITSYSGTGSANDYVDITGVQLEIGTSATPFERRLYNQELANCQRYYYRYKAQSTGDVFAWGFCGSSTIAYVNISFPVTMRTAPTALEQSGTASDYRINSGATLTNCTSVPAFTSATTGVAQITATSASVLTTGFAANLIANSGTNAYLGWGAEL